MTPSFPLSRRRRLHRRPRPQRILPPVLGSHLRSHRGHAAVARLQSQESGRPLPGRRFQSGRLLRARVRPLRPDVPHLSGDAVPADGAGAVWQRHLLQRTVHAVLPGGGRPGARAQQHVRHRVKREREGEGGVDLQGSKRVTDKKNRHKHTRSPSSHRPGGPAPGPPASRGAAHSTRRMRLS